MRPISIDLPKLKELLPDDPVANMPYMEMSLRAAVAHTTSWRWIRGDTMMPWSTYEYLRLQIEYPRLVKPHPRCRKALAEYLRKKVEAA